MKAHQEYFMDCHLAGRKYHDADLVWDDLRVGMEVRLEREPDNRFDANAIQVIFNLDGEDYLLGYIPRNENGKMAVLMDAGWDIFNCRISRLNPESHPEDQVQLTIRIKRNEKKNNRRQPKDNEDTMN